MLTIMPEIFRSRPTWSAVKERNAVGSCGECNIICISTTLLRIGSDVLLPVGPTEWAELL